jgi:CheY-like chemotaxis protein
MNEAEKEVTSQQLCGTTAQPMGDETGRPMDLIDTVFAVLGVETGDSLFAGDFSGQTERSDQPCVLSIDDDDDLALALQLRLQAYGARVIRATAGIEGCRRAITELPRAIILDYELPQCNGDYVLRRLKESPATRNIPVMVLTGHTETAIEQQMWELGAAEYLTKPLDWNRLRAALRIFLDADKATDGESSLNTRPLRLGCPTAGASTGLPAQR